MDSTNDIQGLIDLVCDRINASYKASGLKRDLVSNEIFQLPTVSTELFIARTNWVSIIDGKFIRSKPDYLFTFYVPTFDSDWIEYWDNDYRDFNRQESDALRRKEPIGVLADTEKQELINQLTELIRWSEKRYRYVIQFSNS
ncbi:hypothetical protein [Chroococcidiopsis sp.]|uniref:hypothetical protein n=1 Tax=Chroococcidiopsis sp. TaxID=3088168 RepID=UPI003F352458